jgi:hypothetical protein
MQQKTIYILLALAFLLAGGCKDSDDNSHVEVTPELFLGKWQEIARGNETYPELTPDGHVIEFLEDGTYHRFLNDGNVLTRSYRVDAEFVYYDYGTKPYGHIDRYSFSSTNRLRLDYVDGPKTATMQTPDFYIYKRIK